MRKMKVIHPKNNKKDIQTFEPCKAAVTAYSYPVNCEKYQENVYGEAFSE